MAEIVVRSATEHDAVAICPLINDELGYPEVTPEGVAQRIRAMDAQPDYHVFVACSEHELAGFIVLVQGIALEMDKPYLRVLALAVKASCQGRGVGRLLLQAAEQTAHAGGAGKLLLSSAFARKGAHAFYERCGFVQKGISFFKTI